MGLTWHVREREDALIEAIGEQVPLELLQDGHTHTEGEGGIPQGQDVYGESTSEVTVYHQSQADTYE